MERAVLKISLLHDEVCNFLARVQHIPPEVSARAVAQANGLLLLALDGAPGTLARLIRSLRTEALELGGSMFAQSLPSILRESMDAWGEPPATLALMREIKRRFDPNSTLNPGRFAGGI
jgi:glycolate oxidase FAD binding subunit